jgi:ketosteroid isomerase-like protein
MKNKVISGVILYVMLLLIGCNSKKDESLLVVDKEQIKKEIQATENEFADTYNSGELKNIDYYAEDATTFAQNKKPLVGREAIVDYLKVDGVSKSNKISFTTNDVFVSNDKNIVVEIGHYEVVDSLKTAINTGNYMVLFEKRNGRYLCVRDMSVSDMSIE